MTDGKKTMKEQVERFMHLLFDRYHSHGGDTEEGDKAHLAEVERLAGIRAEFATEVEDLALEVERVTLERNEALAEIERLRAAAHQPVEAVEPAEPATPEPPEEGLQE